MNNAQNLIEEIRALEAEYKAGKISSADLKHGKAIEVAGDDLALRSQFNTMIDGILTVAKAV